MGTILALVDHGEGHTTRCTIRCGFVDHALTKQFVKRFIDGGEAKVTKGFGHEASVNEVHLCVFNAPAVKINGHPMVGDG